MAPSAVRLTCTAGPPSPVIRRAMKALFAVILLVLAVPCSTGVVRAQEPGDSPSLLLAKFGRPEMSRTSGNRELWFYGDGARVVFEDGKLVEFVPSVSKPLPVKRKVARVAAPEPTPPPAPVQQVKPTPPPVAVKPPPPPAPAAKPKDEPKPESIALGPLQIRTLPIMIAAALAYGALVLVLHQRFNAADHKAGAVALAGFFGVTIVAGVISLASVRHGIGPLELLGVVILVASFASVWKGSSLAFGTYVVLQAITAAFFVLGAIYLQSWLMVVPALGAATSVAILYSKPVGGFLDRYKVVEEPLPTPQPEPADVTDR